MEDRWRYGDLRIRRHLSRYGQHSLQLCCGKGGWNRLVTAFTVLFYPMADVVGVVVVGWQWHGNRGS